MIKVEELRCGNLVEFKGQHVPIVKIDSQNELIDQDAIFSYKGSVVVPEYSPDGRIWNYNSPWVQRIKPIPLTEEWLQRAGFDQRNGRTTWTLIVGDPGEFETSLQVGWVGKGYVQVCRSGINARSCPVHYLHQLQNLYFALTQEELTIK